MGLKHVLVIVVLWQLLRLFLPVRFVGGSHRRIQLRGGSRKDAGFQVGHERGIDHGPVFVCDRHVRADSRRPFPPDRRQRGQPRREQEEGDLLELIKPDDLSQDRKGRVVHHHGVRRIVEPLIVSAGIEGADEPPPVQAVLLRHKLRHGFVHVGGGVAVVRGLLRLEFLHEPVVCFVAHTVLLLYLPPMSRSMTSSIFSPSITVFRLSQL